MTIEHPSHNNDIEPQAAESELSPELQDFVRTPEFKEWFGDWENDPSSASKLVGKNGEPLLVYVGLPAGISRLSGDHRLHTGADEVGYYFTKRISNARSMAAQRRDPVTDEAVPSSVYGAFLNVRRPHVVQPGDNIDTTRVTELPENIDAYINDKLQEIVVFDPDQVALVEEVRIH